LTVLLHDYVARHAEHSAESVALVMGEICLTYSELESASNRLARMLTHAGCGPGERVCLLTEKSPAAIIAMLATLKAGGAYVPIDIASPAARVARILKAADPGAMLVLGSATGLLQQLREAGAVPADMVLGALDDPALGAGDVPWRFGPEEVAGQLDEPLGLGGHETDLAHILFTSGSTGEPKGVVITHANVTAFVEWAVAYFGTQPEDRISGHPPLHFDLSTFDVYATFRAGAQLHLVPPQTLLPQQLAQFITGSRLTQWFCVPSTMTYMARLGAVPPGSFPSLERVLWCGEVLPTPILVHWMQSVPQATFTNLYGPTEATIASSYYTIPQIPGNPSAPVPIGEACAGEELLVLGPDLREVPVREVGDLFIAGAGLSPGYWRDEEKTRAAFLADPRPDHAGQRLYRTGDLARQGDDDLFYFLGRADSQIKSRGYRIELMEIESAVNTLPQVAECAVIAVDSAGFEGTAICCAYASRNGEEIAIAALRGQLSALLPRYMLPGRWRAMTALPKNLNGKIDRRALREMFNSESPVPPPS